MIAKHAAMGIENNDCIIRGIRDAVKICSWFTGRNASLMSWYNE